MAPRSRWGSVGYPRQLGSLPFCSRRSWCICELLGEAGPTNESTVTTRVEYHMTGPGATSLLPTGDLIVAATTHPHPATRDLFGHHSWALPPKVWALGGVAF